MAPSSSLFRENVLAVMALADILRSSLGPNAHSKLIHTPQGDVIVSQDGASILRHLQVTQPATAILVESVLTLDEYIGDGTTSATILAASLIQQGYIQNSQNGVPASTIVRGYRKALDFIVGEMLSEEHVSNMITKRVPDLSDRDQVRTAISTALSSKVSVFDDYLSQLLTDAVMRVATRNQETGTYNFDSKSIQFLPVSGGTLKQAQVISGVLVPGQSATVVCEMSQNADGVPLRIAIINDSIQRQRTRTKHTATLETPEQLRRWKVEEEQIFQDQALYISDLGANIVLCSGRVHNIILHHLQALGILCIPNVRESVLLHACRCFGARMVPNLNILASSHLGQVHEAKIVEIGGHASKFTRLLSVPQISGDGDEPTTPEISSTQSMPVTVLIRGSTMEQCHEYVRHCHDVISSVASLSENPQLLPGGSAFELQCIARLEQHAEKMDTMDKIGITCFAEALHIIPRTLCENSALDPNETMAFLLHEHRKNRRCTLGVPNTNSLDANAHDSFDMRRHQVFDSLLTKRSVIQTAVNVASATLLS